METAEQLIHTTVRIEALDQNNVPHAGTGFFFEFKYEGTEVVPVIVTNRHVLEGMTFVAIHLTYADGNGNPLYGKYERIQLSNVQGRILYHPDITVDLAIIFTADIFRMLGSQGKATFHRATTEETLATRALIDSITAFEEVVMIGYPNGIWDATNNLPILRRGYTATPFVRDYENRKEFVIDAACFPGSSGSPVFLFNRGPYSTGGSGIVLGSRLALLGILYAGPQITVRGDIVVESIPTTMRPAPITVSRFPTHLGYCIKASRILDFVPAVRQRVADAQSNKVVGDSTEGE
jgi:V8-like Glu-specific endopeptidase